MKINGFFFLGIHEFRASSGKTIYGIQHRSKEIQDEAILTLVRNWLKKQEDDYYNKFKK